MNSLGSKERILVRLRFDDLQEGPRSSPLQEDSEPQIALYFLQPWRIGRVCIEIPRGPLL